MNKKMQEDLSDKLMHDVLSRSMVRALAMYETSQNEIYKETALNEGNMMHLAVCVMAETMAHNMENILLTDVFKVLIEEVFDVKGKEAEETMHAFNEAMKSERERVLEMWNKTGLREEMIKSVRESLGK